MAVADEDVEVSQWEHAATPAAVLMLRRALRCFATERRMGRVALDALDLALCEVVAHGVSSAADSMSDELIAVAAAADHEWVSVSVTYGRSDLDHTVLALATLSRTGWRFPRSSRGRTRVLLEFALMPEAVIVDVVDVVDAGDRRRATDG